MQFVGNLTDTDLSEVRKGIRSKTFLRATNAGIKPNLVFRWLGVVMALASAAAISLVAVLSIGCYGAVKLLARIRPLHDAYQFLSRAYDRFLERLGQKVLKDSRDTPALRLMVSLSLSAVPIFVIQLVSGKPRLLLVIAFYLSLYGLKFERFVRMFSAKHLEAHRKQLATSRGDTTRCSAATSNSSSDICMGTFRNWIGRRMCVCTTERTAGSTTLPRRAATIGRAGWTRAERPFPGPGPGCGR